MNKLELQQSTDGYSIATVGDLSSFEGKAFVKDILGTTSWNCQWAPWPQVPPYPSSTTTNRTRRCM